MCVVTGGLGFIGSNVCHELVRRGAAVRIIDASIDSHGGDRRNVEGLGLEVVDAEIGDDVVAEAVADADIIFNLAGQVSHIASMRDPLRDLHFNAISHASFLETLRRVNPAVRVVHTSTRQVYGRPIRLPVDELHPTRPMDVNGVSKLAGEQLHMVYHSAHAMPTTSLRLTNVYGPRQKLTSDELGFFPVFIRKGLTGEKIQIFGDGSQRRDCVYVDDVVEALLAATAPEAIGKIFNVGHVLDHSS
jgi:UDP-glucose 4-epimerase